MHTSHSSNHPLTVRVAQADDRKALRRLALLDSRPADDADDLAGAALVAESCGELIAALPLDGGAAIADPFKPSADALTLLRLRSRQLERAA
jgi:hypothetical protein